MNLTRIYIFILIGFYTLASAQDTLDITELGGLLTSQHSNISAYVIDNTIDNQPATKFATLNSSTWIQFHSMVNSVISSYTLTSANNSPDRDPLNWCLLASDDIENWDTLDVRTNEDFPERMQTRYFEITNSTPYQTYRLYMENNNGNILQLGEWELLGSILDDGVTEVPYAPSELTSTAVASDSIIIGWKDNSDNESAFRIDISENSNDWTPVVIVRANVSSYEIGELKANTSYYFRVIAGNSKGLSDYSNISSAMTLAPEDVGEGFVWCANEGDSYTFNEPVDVAYGANGSYHYKYGVTGTVVFNNANFGDPAPDIAKDGYYKPSNFITDGKAQWIWQEADGPNNTWLCMRKKVALTANPDEAITRIAAENKYWLYVNNELVVRDGGLDLRPDLSNTYYDTIDLAPYLVEGQNTIAVLVWYKGGNNGYSQHMVGKGGFLFDSEVSGTSPEKIISDDTWKVKVNSAFVRTSQQQQWSAWKWVEYPVNYDARLELNNWTSPEYDDSDWQHATLKGIPPSAPWNDLVHRTIPMFRNSDVAEYLNESSLLGSFSTDKKLVAEIGNNLQGYAYLKLDAPAGVIINIRMNEWYTEKYVTSAGEQEYITYQWQNASGQPWSKHCVEYSFSNVTGNVEIQDIGFIESGYNTEFLGSFKCDNSRLNTLWDKCKNTSYVCMRDHFYDCPDRERSQWWGDVSEQILYSFYLFDERASLLAKKGFRELMNTQKSDKSLYTTAPGTDFHLPDQNLAAVMSLGDYYLYTGDEELINELYPKIRDYIKQYVDGTRNEDGMLILQNGPWNWIDWGDNLDVKNGSANTVVNGLFIRLMDTAKLLAGTAGFTDDIPYYQSLQDEVRSNFNKYFWNSTSNSYVFYNFNGTLSPTIDDRSNAWAVLAGMADSSRESGVMTVLNTKQNASPYQERYIEEAMFRLGRNDEALDRMLSYYEPDIDSWSQTMWERMGNNSTNNHAWAASPCYLLGAFVAGVRPTSPGFATYEVLPNMGYLKSVFAEVPSPKGIISVSHLLEDTCFISELSSPESTEAAIGIPESYEIKSISVNGETIWESGSFIGEDSSIEYMGIEDGFIKFKVGSGTFIFQADLVTTETHTNAITPLQYSLSQNYPNPFNPVTTINFSVPEKSKVDLTVYNILGERIANLCSKEFQAGYHNIAFNANNYNSGVYFCRMETQEYNSLVKMILLK